MRLNKPQEKILLWKVAKKIIQAKMCRKRKHSRMSLKAKRNKLEHLEQHVLRVFLPRKKWNKEGSKPVRMRTIGYAHFKIIYDECNSVQFAVVLLALCGLSLSIHYVLISKLNALIGDCKKIHKSITINKMQSKEYY